MLVHAGWKQVETITDGFDAGNFLLDGPGLLVGSSGLFWLFRLMLSELLATWPSPTGIGLCDL